MPQRQPICATSNVVYCTSQGLCHTSLQCLFLCGFMACFYMKWKKSKNLTLYFFILQYKYANYTNRKYTKTGKGSIKFQLIKQRSDISFALFTGGISNVCLFMSLSYALHSVLSDLYILHAPNYIEQMHWLVRVSYILFCFKKKVDVL